MKVYVVNYHPANNSVEQKEDGKMYVVLKEVEFKLNK